jgi:hypothetical protein
MIEDDFRKNYEKSITFGVSMCEKHYLQVLTID